MIRLFALLVLVLTTQRALGQNDKLNIYTEQQDGSIFVYADNAQLYPQSVSLTLDLKGLKPKEPVPDWIVVPPGSQKMLLSELVIPLNRSWSYSYSYLYYKGNINAEHNDAYEYRLPYQTGKSFKLVQGYFGAASHAGKRALDFNMPEGETVVAARPGIVIEIKEDSDRGCPDQRCAKLGNYVTIMHDDGTFADYYHLQKDGALVNPGDEVEAGQEIGLSGSTGWATGPHLHFIVYKPSENGKESFPTRFKTGGPEAILLTVKESYTAVE